MATVDDALTGRIIRCAMTVHEKLGPGFVESIYQNALLIELRKAGLGFVCECPVRVYYDGEEVGTHRVDLLVEQAVIVELKAVDKLTGSHYAQLRSYLRAMKLDVGLLMNFSGERLDFRRVHPRGGL